MPGKDRKHVRFAKQKIEYSIPPNPSPAYTSSTLPSSDGPITPPFRRATLPGYPPYSYSVPPPKPVMQSIRAHNLLGYSRQPALNFDVRLSISHLTSRYSSLSTLLLAEPAVTPAVSSLVLTTHRLPWSITIYPSNGYYVTVRDVLDAIYHALRKNVSHSEYHSQRDQVRINEAYQRRYGRIRDYYASREEKKGGVKRVDFLCGRTRFTGLSPSKKSNIWEMHFDYN
ncbi:hypothetical protein V5O48_008942 [Marasmius crinis-equi]|uniref:DUF6699 domain-containing protein n=1 Tax=Marasmius crinis-equi TaxID=585013 RepID=A0ABR3FCG7_9AGAR